MDFVRLVGQDDIPVVHQAAPPLQRGPFADAAHPVGLWDLRDAGRAQGGRTWCPQATVVQGIIIAVGGEHGVQDPGGLPHPWAVLRNLRIFCLQHRVKLEKEGEREREKRRVRECRESEHRDRREGRSEDRQPPSWEVIIHPKPGPMDLLFPWQPRAGKPLLRSCLATDAGDGVEDHELCP